LSGKRGHSKEQIRNKASSARKKAAPSLKR